MTDTPTPGQIAYEAWWRVHCDLPCTDVSFGFERLRPQEQAAWEAAALSVLDAWQAQPRMETP